MSASGHPYSIPNRIVEARDASFSDGRLSGTFAARIPTSDAARWPHILSLGLLLHEGKLAGEVTANSRAERIYFSLSSYAELTRK